MNCHYCWIGQFGTWKRADVTNWVSNIRTSIINEKLNLFGWASPQNNFLSLHELYLTQAIGQPLLSYPGVCFNCSWTQCKMVLINLCFDCTLNFFGFCWFVFFSFICMCVCVCVCVCVLTIFLFIYFVHA